MKKHTNLLPVLNKLSTPTTTFWVYLEIIARISRQSSDSFQQKILRLVHK
jgi:hypothetical protein